jgi:hemoglobin/transferrin/lactoferrin receptor protein
MVRVCFILFAFTACASDLRIMPGGTAKASARIVAPSGVTLWEAAVSDSIPLPALPPGTYLLTIRASGYAQAEQPVAFPADADVTVELTEVALENKITITAQRGSVVSAEDSPASTKGRDIASFREKPVPTTGHLLENTAGVLLQQTGSSQISPFLRGFTGYHVLNLIDGVRFNNSTFRSGPNQYLAFTDPSQMQRIETYLGPASSEYGSDSLGGAIQIFTRESRFSDGKTNIRGDGAIYGSSADLSAGTDGQIMAAGTRWMWLGGAHGRLHNSLRPGEGHDSRHALRRYLGLNNEQIASITGGTRLVDSAFRQHGFHTKFSLKPTANQVLTAWYQRGEQTGAKNYKDLWGGLGRLQSGLLPQVLDFTYLRYEKTSLGPIDSLSGTFSFNRQQDGTARQNLRRTDRTTTDVNAVGAYGYTAQASTHLGSRQAIVFGGELYNESIASTRNEFDPAANRSLRLRPLYPDNSRYRNGGLFAQDRIELLRNRLRITAGLRWTRASYRTLQDSFGVAASNQAFNDVTYNTSALWQIRPGLGIHALVGRGFRAPNANDLGAVGLNDLGYEIPATAATGALLGDSAGEGALSLGRNTAGLSAEKLFNYEFGIRVRKGKTSGRLQLFDSELHDPIVRRTLLFPANQVPATLAGLNVTAITPTAAQRAQGVVTVATSIDPRAVKAFVNDGRSRYYGIEAQGQAQLSSRLLFEANYFYIRGRDLNPNRNIRRLPPQQGSVRIRYGTSRYWVESSVSANGAQDRLSGGDIDDERIGASRSRRDIASFFAGSRLAPFIDSQGRFLPTGETLVQIQNRVLPASLAETVRVPLYTSTAGWATWNLSGGYRISEHLTWHGAALNLLDRNFRIHGSGIDAPGINLYTALRLVF